MFKRLEINRDKMQKLKLQFKIKSLAFLVVFFVFLFLNVNKANAAGLFIEAGNNNFAPQEEFIVSIFLDSPQESINAVEAKIVFPEALLSLEEIRDGNSIINFWLDPAKKGVSNGVERSDAIIFSGIIPGGYQETKGLILSAVFRAKSSGSGVIEIRDAKLLQNDGKGTSAKVEIKNFEFEILDFKEDLNPKSQVLNIKVNDTNPPEDFQPKIMQNADMFGGKIFLVFAAQDKGLGIDHYEISESRNQKTENRMWEMAESPYVLHDQKLQSFIYVKAVDKSGNERVATVEPKYPLRHYENNWFWVIIYILVILCIGYLIRVILKNFQKGHGKKYEKK